mmetsp:Transcript_40583/g.67904  ORF Transcript_40583/g.67904 Transcript_40583/m.67904 type:complete len:123 (-) Transcript_40583:117-485(-)
MLKVTMIFVSEPESLAPVASGRRAVGEALGLNVFNAATVEGEVEERGVGDLVCGCLLGEWVGPGVDGDEEEGDFVRGDFVGCEDDGEKEGDKVCGCVLGEFVGRKEDGDREGDIVVGVHVVG